MEEEKDFIAPDGCHYENGKQWLFIGLLKGCGCGSSDFFSDECWKLLEHFSKPHAEREKLDIYENNFLELLAHMLSGADLIEHGTSVGGSWLTPKGEETYWLIKQSLTPSP